MLDTVGKILERVLVTRLEKALTNAGGLSPNKYGRTDAAERVHQIARDSIKGDRWMYGSKEYCLDRHDITARLLMNFIVNQKVFGGSVDYHMHTFYFGC